MDVQPLGTLVLDAVLDAHAHRVRHLLVREVEDLLAHDLRDVERLGLVARRVGREEQGVLRQRAHEEVEQAVAVGAVGRSEEHTSELQSHSDLVCRLLLEKKKIKKKKKT